MWLTLSFFFFFFNDTATTEIYTLSLHDALPIWEDRAGDGAPAADVGQVRSDDAGRHPLNRVTGETGRVQEHLFPACGEAARGRGRGSADRKSTRLNSSH